MTLFSAMASHSWLPSFVDEREVEARACPSRLGAMSVHSRHRIFHHRCTIVCIRCGSYSTWVNRRRRRECWRNPSKLGMEVLKRMANHEVLNIRRSAGMVAAERRARPRPPCAVPDPAWRTGRWEEEGGERAQPPEGFQTSFPVAACLWFFSFLRASGFFSVWKPGSRQKSVTRSCLFDALTTFSLSLVPKELWTLCVSHKSVGQQCKVGINFHSPLDPSLLQRTPHDLMNLSLPTGKFLTDRGLTSFDQIVETWTVFSLSWRLWPRQRLFFLEVVGTDFFRSRALGECAWKS